MFNSTVFLHDINRDRSGVEPQFFFATETKNC